MSGFYAQLYLFVMCVFFFVYVPLIIPLLGYTERQKMVNISHYVLLHIIKVSIAIHSSDHKN